MVPRQHKATKVSLLGVNVCFLTVLVSAMLKICFVVLSGKTLNNSKDNNMMIMIRISQSIIETYKMKRV